VVRDFLHDQVLGQEDKLLSKYLKPDLLIIDKCGVFKNVKSAARAAVLAIQWLE
jgi:hypothetical protein